MTMSTDMKEKTFCIFTSQMYIQVYIFVLESVDLVRRTFAKFSVM